MKQGWLVSHSPPHTELYDILIAQPVPKIDALDHGRGPLVARDEGDSLEHVFDVAMAPVLAFDGGDGGDVWFVTG